MSCARTYVTLSFYHENYQADEVSKILAVTPTRTTEKDEQKKINKNGWFFQLKEQLTQRMYVNILNSYLIYLKIKKMSLTPLEIRIGLQEFIVFGNQQQVMVVQSLIIE